MRRNHKIICAVCVFLVLALIAVGAGLSFERLNNDKVCHDDDGCITVSDRFHYHPRYVI